jgi:putative membrane protein
MQLGNVIAIQSSRTGERAMKRSPGLGYVSAVTMALCLTAIARAAITEQDRAFLIKAAQANVNEFRLSKLANARASRPEVKTYASKMVADHQMLEKKLRPFAMAWSVTLPRTLDAEHRAAYKKLRRLSGAAFDKAYMDNMATDHNATLVAFTHEADIVSDPDFKSTVISEKSVIAAHTNMADDLKSKL